MDARQAIWILEDDQNVMQLYESIFASRYELRSFECLRAFVDEIATAERKPDLVIADLKLPDGSFIDYISHRGLSKQATTDYLVISGVDDADALRFCFANGVVEYLTKPFRVSEVAVKVELMLNTRRERAAKLELDYDTMTVRRFHLKSPILTSKEFLIVNFLNKSPNNRATREQLMQAVWPEKKISPKTMDVHLFNLRRKLMAVQIEIKFTSPNVYSICALPVDVVG